MLNKLLAGPVVFAAGAVVGFWGQSARLTPRMQARQDTLAYQRGVNETLREQLAGNVARIDTVEVPRWRVLRDSAQTILPDTGKYGIAARALNVADSTINSCRRVLGDCTALADSLRSEVATNKRQLADALRIRGPRLSKNLYAATDLKGGIFAGAEARLRLPVVEVFGRYEARLDSAGTALRVGAVIPF